MTEYAILWKPRPRRRLRGGAGQLGSGAESGETLNKITLESMDDQQAAEAAASPDVESMAPAMKTCLVKPMAAGGEGAKPWGVKAVGAKASAFTGAGVKVAVLDTGIQADHVAFDGMRLVQKDFTGTGKGDRNGHGTHCAGILFGRDVGGERIGIARGITRAFIGKVLDDAGGGTSTMIFDGLDWAMQQKADIISMSLGFDFPGEVAEKVDAGWPAELATSNALVAFHKNLTMFQAIMVRAQANGGFGTAPLIVAAAGNESRRDGQPGFRVATSIPAACVHMSVAAVGLEDRDYRVWERSNADPVIAAPGVDILSAGLGGGLTSMSGTSAACPHVAGVAALWAERLRREDEEVSGQVLLSHLIAGAKRDRILGPRSDVRRDVGRGLVQSP